MSMSIVDLYVNAYEVKARCGWLGRWCTGVFAAAAAGPIVR